MLHFHTMNSYNNTKKLTPYFKDWLEHAEKSKSSGEIKEPPVNLNRNLSHKKPRGKRTFISSTNKINLERFYNKNPHPRKSEVKKIAIVCDLKEDTVRNWFNNHRSSHKIKTEVKEEIQSGIKELNSPKVSINNQVNTVVDEKVGIINPSVVDLTDDSSESQNFDFSPISDELAIKINEFQLDLHNFETVDLGSLLAQ